MGSLGPPPVPVVDQHGDGSGNAPPSPTAGAEFRALKDGQAIQRINAMNVATPLLVTARATCADDYADRIDTLLNKCLLILEEAIESLVPPAPQPIPDPTTDRPPVEPDSRP